MHSMSGGAVRGRTNTPPARTRQGTPGNCACRDRWARLAQQDAQFPGDPVAGRRGVLEPSGSAVMVGGLGGFLQLAVDLVEQFLGLRRVSTHVPLIGLLGLG